jgi:hypothetical protein
MGVDVAVRRVLRARVWSMMHDNERQGLRSSVTRRRFMLSTSMLPFATWAAGLDGGVTATTGVSGSSEVAPPKVTDVLNVRGFEPLARWHCHQLTSAISPPASMTIAHCDETKRHSATTKSAPGALSTCRGSILAPRYSALTGARRSIFLPFLRCVLFTPTGKQRWRVRPRADRPS